MLSDILKFSEILLQTMLQWWDRKSILFGATFFVAEVCVIKVELLNALRKSLSELDVFLMEFRSALLELPESVCTGLMP